MLNKPIVETENYELFVAGGITITNDKTVDAGPKHYAVRNKNHDVVEFRSEVLQDAKAIIEAFEAQTYPKSVKH